MVVHMFFSLDTADSVGTPSEGVGKSFFFFSSNCSLLYVPTRTASLYNSMKGAVRIIGSELLSFISVADPVSF